MTTSFHIEDVDGLHSRTAKTCTGSDSSRTSTEAHWHGCCTTEARVRAPLPDNTAWLCEARASAPTHSARRDRWPPHPTSSGVTLTHSRQPRLMTRHGPLSGPDLPDFLAGARFLLRTV